MKNIFVINPKAGKTDATQSVMEAAKAADIQAEFYVTKSSSDAECFVRETAELATEPIRFIACGGDGTINEVVNGAYGFDNVCVRPYPSGSGNDFIKYYGAKADFLDLSALEEDEIVPADLMHVDGKYSINVINFGFDTAVCRTMINVKRKPIIGGRNAYYTGVVYAFINAMKSVCTVRVDGKPLNEKLIMLCTVAHGTHVGGSFKCAPRTDNTDGLAEVCLVKPISRFSVAKLIKKYMNGEHLDDPRFADIISYARGKHIEVEAADGFAYCLDGEIIYNNKFVIDVVPGAMNISIPKSLARAREATKATV